MGRKENPLESARIPSFRRKLWLFQRACNQLIVMDKPNPIPVRQSRRGRNKRHVACEPAIEPATGIHSRAWADAIVPQDCGFLRLPLEIRLKIYEHVIRDFSFGRSAIEPRKNRMKFKSYGWAHADRGIYLPFFSSYL
jgi:hypothetical protein